MKVWMEWIEALIQRFHGSVRDLALSANIAENKISRWRYGHNLPGPDDQLKLATVSGGDADAIMKMVWNADRERIQARELRRRGGTANLSRSVPTKPGTKVTPSRLYRGELRPAMAL